MVCFTFNVVLKEAFLVIGAGCELAVIGFCIFHERPLLSLTISVGFHVCFF